MAAITDAPLAGWLDRLSTLTRDLSSLHRELATVLVAELQAKDAAWFATESDTVSVRDRFASHNALNLTADIIRLKGEIESLREERSHLRLLICLFTDQTLEAP